MSSVLNLLLITFCRASFVESLNILGVFPYEGRSHFFVYEKYLEALAERGHNLTVISHFPRKDVIPNYHDVSLAGTLKVQEDFVPITRSFWTIIKSMHYITTTGNKNCKVMLEEESVQELWKTKREFDLVVIQHFNSDCGLGLAHKIGAPVVGLTVNDMMPWQLRTFGIPFNPSYVPFILTGSLHPNLYERVENTVLDFIYTYKYANAQKVDQETLGKHFDDIPPLELLSREMKFLLLYQNFVLSGSRLLPPNVIEVGGYHIVPPKPLPEDLLKFINDSIHGIIYISFGSLLRDSTLSDHKMNVILDALSSLPQRVIWKWKGKTFPAKTDNIYVSPWLPQNDLLAHPKVVAFFSHGGMLSTTEAIHYGVPMVVMPILGDQPINAAYVEASGLGVQIAISKLTKENLLNKFNIVLNSNFKSRVKSLSEAFRDRPVTAMNNAIFWTEFAACRNLTVISRAVDVPLFQYLCLDVFLVLAIIAIAILFFIYKVIMTVFTILKQLLNSKSKIKRN